MGDDYLAETIVIEKKKFNGAHDGGIPPGWDFPEARAAAEEGLDLWLLDSTYRESLEQRFKSAVNGARFAGQLREAGASKYGS
jgi:hypothetical protein